MLNLFYPSKRFCGGCQQWDRYDEQEMSVILKPVKRYSFHKRVYVKLMIRSELPHYCFPDGLPKKKKGKRVQQTVSWSPRFEDEADHRLHPSLEPRMVQKGLGRARKQSMSPLTEPLGTVDN